MDYNEYWNHRGFEINKNLKPREEIMMRIIPAMSKVVDVGCGNSGLASALIDKGADVFISDISPLVVNEYKKLGIEGKVINFEDVESLNFPQRADYMILSEVLEHTRNPEEIILKLKSQTERFVITLPNSAYYRFRLSLMFGGRFFTQWVHHPSEHLRFWSHIDFLDWLDALGLKIEKIYVSDGFTFRGLLHFIPRLWKNFLGFRMVYICKVGE